MTWDGLERRKNMQHNGILPECHEVFKRIEGKIDDLIKTNDKINGRYEHHLESSEIYRHKVTKNDVRIVILQWVLAVLVIPMIFIFLKVYR